MLKLSIALARIGEPATACGAIYKISKRHFETFI